MRHLLFVAIVACSGANGGMAGDPNRASNDANAGAWWHPKAGASWDWQLATPVDTSANVDVYDIDMFNNDASVIAALHAKGRRVVCYVDAGSYEDFRPDAKQFPASVLGAGYKGFPNERWLDIRKLDVLGPILRARFDLAKSKGCDAIEPDNIDGYDTTAHEPTGFPLTADDQLAYDRWLAAEAHARGMAIGLKNDLDQVKDLVHVFDFEVSEQAFEYDEAQAFVAFIAEDKPVFECEYNLALSAFCPRANDLNFSAIKKHDQLDAWRQACR